MAKELKLRRGTTAEHSTFTGAEGEVTIDTTKDTAVVHDGVTAGGIPLAKEADIPTGALASLNEVDASTIADNSVGAAELNVPGNGSAGQYLASDGDGTMTWTSLPVAAGGFANMEVFNASGTWTNPGNITKVKVTVVGGGGGAGTTPNPGGGGGAGGAAIEVISFPSGTNVPVTVGGGGNGSNSPPNFTNSNPGGTSSFGGYCSATGGEKGWDGADYNSLFGIGGQGGLGSGGDINIRGCVGTNGGTPTINTASGGHGGNSIFGSGGRGSKAGTGGYNADPGLLGGGGGGGALSAASRGNGGSGIVVVEY